MLFVNKDSENLYKEIHFNIFNCIFPFFDERFDLFVLVFSEGVDQDFILTELLFFLLNLLLVIFKSFGKATSYCFFEFSLKFLKNDLIFSFEMMNFDYFGHGS
jgi:hypothetical protein